VRCRSRGIFAPDFIEQTLDGHDFAPEKQQCCQHGALLAPAKLERAFPELGLEPAENAELERF
jgi:hypothetical protein